MATKAKIAHPKRRTKRAAKPSTGMTIGEALKAAEADEGSKPLAPLKEGKAKAERAVLPSIVTPKDDAALQLAFLKDHLVRATDLVSESLAGLLDQETRESEYIDTDAIRANLSEILTALWQVRWECYAIGGEVKVAKQTGGAS